MPYEVNVSKPVVQFEDVVEEYYVNVPEVKELTYEVTETLPVVTRQCTDARGKIIKEGELDLVPLIASGPTRAQLNIDNKDPFEDKPENLTDFDESQLKKDEDEPDLEKALEIEKGKMSQKATLVLAPIDYRTPIGFIQVWGISHNG